MKKYCVVMFFMVCISSSFAQISNPLDDKYKPHPTSIFGSNNQSNSSARNIRTSTRKMNQFTLLVTDVSRSNIRIDYERKLSNSMAAIGGFAFSYGKDYMERHMNLYEMSRDLDNYSNTGRPLDYLYEASNIKNGYSVLLGLKLYYNEEDSYSSYFSLQWKMTNANYTLQNEQYSYNYYEPSPKNIEYNVNLNYFSICMGTSFRYNISKIVLINDFSYGIGLKLVYFDKYIAARKPSELQVNGNDEWFIKTNHRENYLNPYILFRYQLGIAW